MQPDAAAQPPMRPIDPNAPATESIALALQGLAAHQFDPTLRQLVAQVFGQEAAGIQAAQALKEANVIIHQLRAALDGKERELQAARAEAAAIREQQEMAARDQAERDAIPETNANGAVDGKELTNGLMARKR